GRFNQASAHDLFEVGLAPQLEHALGARSMLAREKLPELAAMQVFTGHHPGELTAIGSPDAVVRPRFEQTAPPLSEAPLYEIAIDDLGVGLARSVELAELPERAVAAALACPCDLRSGEGL